MAADLAPVYLDDTRVTLQGDPRPKVAKILQAGGRPTDARVVLQGAAGQPRALGPDEVIDRTVGPSQPVHLRTSQTAFAPAPANDEGVGGVGGQGSFQGATPGKVLVPGEILRSTETRAAPAPAAPGTSSEQEARSGGSGNPPKAQRFAESQSFADPAHKGGSPRVAPDTQPSKPVPPAAPGRIPEGGLRTQDGGSQEGARTPPRPATATPSNPRSSPNDPLHRASEEE